MRDEERRRSADGRWTHTSSEACRSRGTLKYLLLSRGLRALNEDQRGPQSTSRTDSP